MDRSDIIDPPKTGGFSANKGVDGGGFLDNLGISDFLVDALIIAGIAALAVLAAPTYPVLAVGLGIAAVSLAILEATDDREGNVLDHPDNILIAGGLGMMGAGAVMGSVMTTAIGAGVAVIASTDVVGDFMTNTNSWLWFIIIAVVGYLVYKNRYRLEETKGISKTNWLIMAGAAVAIFLLI